MCVVGLALVLQHHQRHDFRKFSVDIADYGGVVLGLLNTLKADVSENN